MGDRRVVCCPWAFPRPSIGQHAVLVRADLHSLAAAVGTCPTAFFKSRLPRARRKEPPPPGLLDQRLVIKVRLEPQQTETEPVLATGLP